MTDQERIADLEAQVQQLRHRLNGHQQAIARWRQRAGVDPPTEELILYKSEIYNYRDEWRCREYYTMPIERASEMIYEAWAWVLERGLIDITERMYFDLKQGWVLILIRPWHL